MKPQKGDAWTDLGAVRDGISLLGAEVRQDVSGFPLTWVMNSWTSCKKNKNKTSQCFQRRKLDSSQ